MSDPGTGTSAVSTVTFVVPEDAEPQRLDRFLVSVLPEHSRSQIQRLIEDGHVTLVGRTAKANLLVRPGDQMSVVIPAAAPTDARPEDLPLEVLYQDADVAVLNKPAGMVVHPGAGHASGTLVNALLHHISDRKSTRLNSSHTDISRMPSSA